MFLWLRFNVLCALGGSSVVSSTPGAAADCAKAAGHTRLGRPAAFRHPEDAACSAVPAGLLMAACVLMFSYLRRIVRLLWALHLGLLLIVPKLLNDCRPAVFGNEDEACVAAPSADVACVLMRSCLRRIFHLLWAFHLGLLLIVPKLLNELGLADQLRLAMKMQPAALQRLTGLMLAPLLDLCSMAALPSVWLPQVGHPLKRFLTRSS